MKCRFDLAVKKRTVYMESKPLDEKVDSNCNCEDVKNDMNQYCDMWHKLTQMQESSIWFRNSCGLKCKNIMQSCGSFNVILGYELFSLLKALL